MDIEGAIADLIVEVEAAEAAAIGTDGAVEAEIETVDVETDLDHHETANETVEIASVGETTPEIESNGVRPIAQLRRVPGGCETY